VREAQGMLKAKSTEGASLSGAIMSDTQQTFMMRAPNIETYTVGNVHISCVDRARALECFFHLVSTKHGGFITVRDAHGIVEAQADPNLLIIQNRAQLTLPDGIPIVWIGKLKKAAVQKVTGSDFFDDIYADPRARRIRHYFYGGSKETTCRVAARAAKILGADAIAGWHAPPIRPVGALEDASVLDQIAATHPDVIWIGLSTPKQEYWMANHAERFPNAIAVGIGAKFDFFSGDKKRAPKLIQYIGLEWLFRIIQEPKRLGPRYRMVLPGMMKIMIAEVLGRIS
jgi:N-acetylglucosaminyldiphosphoundecaprenol N-acetyl-beta-D-mannosaminyltransferase